MLPRRRGKWAMLTLAILIGCGERGSSVWRVERKADNNTARREWSRNEAILTEAVKGKINTDRFQKSVLFFYELTGISVHGEGTPFGYLPNERTKDDLVRLREWCKQHCDEIYWDEAAQEVKRLPTGGDG